MSQDTEPRPRSPGQEPPRTEADANRLYIAVVNPDLTWWDDLTPEMQAGWLRGARLLAEARQQDREGIRSALERAATNNHEEGRHGGWAGPADFRECADTFCREAARALAAEPQPRCSTCGVPIAEHPLTDACAAEPQAAGEERQ